MMTLVAARTGSRRELWLAANRARHLGQLRRALALYRSILLESPRDVEAALCAAPHSAAQLLPQIFNRPLDGHHLVFALGETIAHLNYLRHRNVIERAGEGGDMRFVRSRSVDASKRAAP